MGLSSAEAIGPASSQLAVSYRGTSLIRNRPPKDHQMALDIGLLQGPRGWALNIGLL